MPGSQELDRFGHHLRAETAEPIAAGVVARTQLALDVEGPAPGAVQRADLREPAEADDRVVLGLLLPVAFGVAPDAVGGETHARHRLAARWQALRVLGQIADEDHPVDHVRLLD